MEISPETEGHETGHYSHFKARAQEVCQKFIPVTWYADSIPDQIISADCSNKSVLVCRFLMHFVERNQDPVITMYRQTTTRFYNSPEVEV